MPITSRIEIELAPIVGDAALAEGTIGEGRLIPLVIVDALARPDLAEFVRVHSMSGPGDVKIRWAQLKGNSDRIVLFLRFTKPAEVNAALEFEIVRQGILVDQILTAKCLYIQPGKAGDRLSETWDAHRLLVEIPDTGFRPTWEVLFEREVVGDFRRRGLSRPQAKVATKQAIAKMREFSSVRAHRGGTKRLVFRFHKPDGA